MTGDVPSPPHEADICIVLEGAYPYVSGGVSTWMHDLVRAQSHLAFHLVALTDTDDARPMRYQLPDNITGMTRIPLQQRRDRVIDGPSVFDLIAEIEPPLRTLLAVGDFEAFRALVTVFRRHRGDGRLAVILNSEAAFEMMERMYQADVPGSSFLNYFWSLRSLLGGLFSTLLAEVPPARAYHAISTGYAGLFMARAVIETGRPGALTEHGIYTNERRIEIAMATWLSDFRSPRLDLENRPRDLRSVWTDAFVAYSRICYAAATRITTLYTGNQVLQSRDGAPGERLQIIPNGVDYGAFSRIGRSPDARPPTVALIGRVVPIKDIKTFIKAAAILKTLIPDVRVLVLGPYEEDRAYHAECTVLVDHLGLGATVTFTGPVDLKAHLPTIDVVALTSISEAQPLVLLECGAAGIPCVATDVGSCREILEGRPDENPALGPGGTIVPLADAEACARAIAALLADPAMRQRYGAALQARVRASYDKTSVDAIYRQLYAGMTGTAADAEAA